MDQNLRLKITLRWGLASAALIAAFWTVWALTHGGHVPHEPLSWLGGKDAPRVSRWWDIFVGPISAYLIMRWRGSVALNEAINSLDAVSVLMVTFMSCLLCPALTSALMFIVEHHKTVTTDPFLIPAAVGGVIGLAIGLGLVNATWKQRLLAPAFWAVLMGAVVAMLAGIVNGGVVLVVTALGSVAVAPIPWLISKAFHWLNAAGEN